MGWFEHRHARDNPAQNPDLSENDHQRHDDFLPGREVVDLRIPFETDDGYVQTIQHDTQQGHDGCDLDDIQASVPVAKGEHESRNQNKTNHFHQEPVAPGVVDHAPLLAVYEQQCFEKIVNKHDNGRALGQAKENVVKGVFGVMGNEMPEHPVTNGALEDNHRQPGVNAGNQKQHGDEL